MCLDLCYVLSLISYPHLSSGQLEEDEVTWGSDELPINNINSKFTEGWSWNSDEAFDEEGHLRNERELVVSQAGWRYLRCFGGIPGRLAVPKTGWTYLWYVCGVTESHIKWVEEISGRFEGTSGGSWGFEVFQESQEC